MKITLDNLRSLPRMDYMRLTPQELLEARTLVRDTQQGHWATCRRILDSAGDRELTAPQRRDYAAAEKQVDELGGLKEQLDDEISRRAIDRTGVVPPAPGDRGPEYREGMPLTDRQTFTGYTRGRSLVPEEEQEGLSLRKSLRGYLFGDWKDAEAEKRAMSGASAGAGRILLPTVLSTDIIDLARNKTQVMAAGARVFPMENRTLDVAKWVTDPSVAWRSENAPVAVSDAALDKITLNAQTLSGMTVISRELLEDADEIESELRDAFAAVVSMRIDQAALYGSGTAPEPRGVKNATPVTLTASMGTNGAALTNYDPLVDAVGALRDNNESPTAFIYSSRTARALAKLKDTTNQPLRAPEYLDGVKRLETNQVPNTLTQGTSTDASDIFTADWSQLYIGVRTQLAISLLTERYADTGQIGLWTWWRGDIAVARPKAFHVTSGVR